MVRGLKFKNKHSSSFNFAVEPLNRPSLPSKRDDYQYVLGKDGAILFPGSLDDRFIEVRFSVVEKNIPTLRKKARQVAAWLSSTKKEVLVFDDEPDVFYRAKVANQIDLRQIVRVGIFTVIFRCEPYAYGQTDTTLVNITNSPQMITVESDGVVNTPQKIIVQNNGSNTIQEFIFEMEEVID